MLSDAGHPSLFYESQSQDQQDNPRNNRNNKSNGGEHKKKKNIKNLFFRKRLISCQSTCFISGSFSFTADSIKPHKETI
jgi:hypothetical protein